MVGAVLRDTRVVVPQVLLTFHALDGGALLVPHLGDVEKNIGLPAHLLGLVRLEQIELGSAQNLLSRIVPPGLRDGAAFDGDARRVGMVGIVRIVVAVAQHEGRLHIADDVNETILVFIGHAQRVVAQIERDQVVDSERGGRVLGFGATDPLDLVERHVRMLPKLGRFTALAKRQADDRHLVAHLRMQRDGAAAAPHEIRRVRTDDQRCLGDGHEYLLVAIPMAIWLHRRRFAN